MPYQIKSNKNEKLIIGRVQVMLYLFVTVKGLCIQHTGVSLLRKV